MDALLKALLHAATGEAVLIFPTTRTRDQLYANENIDGKPYLLLSVKYLVKDFVRLRCRMCKCLRIYTGRIGNW